jgi:hypothetical protein
MSTSVSVIFCFEFFWVHMDDFQEVMQTNWNKTGQLKPTSETYSHQTGSTAREINKWKKTKLVNLALQLALVKGVMFRLEST